MFSAWTLHAAAVSVECEIVNTKANIEIASGHFDGPKAELAGLIARLQRTPGNSLCLGITASNLAVVLQREGNLKEAERYANESVNILQQAEPPTPAPGNLGYDDRTYEQLALAMVRPLQLLAGVYIFQHRMDKAKEVVARLESLPLPASKDVASLAGAKAAIFATEGRVGDAELQYRKSITEWEKAGEGGSLNLVPELNNLALLYMNHGRYAEAAPLLQRAEEALDTSKETADELRLTVLTNLGVFYAKERNWSRAEEVLKDAAAIAGRPGVNPELRRKLYETYVATLKQAGRKRDAKKLEGEVNAMVGSDPSSSVVSLEELKRQK